MLIKQLFLGNECIGYVWGAYPSLIFQLWKCFWICEQESDKVTVYYSLRCLQTDPDFYVLALIYFTPSLIDSSRTFFAGNATLVYHLLSRWILWCYSATCYFISTLVELSFWWSFPSGGAILHTASAYTVVEVFLLLLLLLCSPCPLWWSVGYWHRPVHTATQLNRLSTDLLATGPGFDPRWRPSWSVFYFFYLQRRRSCGSLFWLAVSTNMTCASCVSNEEVRTTCCSYCFHVVVGSSAELAAFFLLLLLQFTFIQIYFYKTNIW